MTEIPIPANAVGRPGMIAMLRNVKAEAAGKLVVVRFPVGYVSTLTASGKPVFAWQVLALAGPVELNGASRFDFVVPDRCLVPVSQIEPAGVDALVEARARREIDAALVDVRRALDAHPMTEQELDAAVIRAVEYVAIEHALEVVPVPVALKELCFRTTFGSEDGAWRWSGMHQGVELVVMAGPDLFGTRWSIVGKCVTSREMMWDERFVLAEEPRGKIALLILDLWREAFGKDAPAPGHFDLGRRFEQHQADLKRIGTGPPTLLVDGEILRATRRWIAQRHGWGDVEVGPLPDLPLALSHGDGSLRLEVAGAVYTVPASGVWVEDCAVWLGEFLAIHPQRLRGHTVSVERSPGSVSFNGCAVTVSGAASAV